jgi:nickel-dependent lactate racemase
VVGAAVLADVAQVVDRTDCIMVSPGIKREETERLGFRYAVTAQEALEMALERQGNEAKIAVLQHGGHILPLSEASGAKNA